MAWALVVIGVAAVGGLAYVLGEGVEELGALSRHVVSVRENTKRYLAELDAQIARYEACLDRGGTQSHCAEVAPIPGAPQERPPPTQDKTYWVMGATVLGVALLAGVGYWGYTKLRRKRPLPTRSLRGKHKRRALRSSYDMEVD